MKKISELWEQKPLLLILFLGGFFRLIAVILSKGYGMSDDHFLVIEPSQSWVDGHDYNNWLPSLTPGLTQASGHSMLYPGLHYLFFLICDKIGFTDPQGKMYIVRLLHAIWSMLVVWIGYKITLRIGGVKAAKAAGLLLAIYFFMPMLSVRNLVEMVCIPPLVLATWYYYRYQTDARKAGFYAGLMLGIAFSIRFQTATFIAGYGLVILLMRNWKMLAWLIIGGVLSVGIVQACTDMIIWGRPFVEFAEYVRYNMENSETYGVSAWYKYLLLLGGIMLPPLSIMLMYGFLQSWRKYLIVFLPAFIFFVFHSMFPNKQERFIMPAVPFIIMGGTAGWYMMLEQSQKQWMYKLTRIAFVVFFVLNTIPLFVISAAYSKRSRVEAMVYLRNKNDANNFCIEQSMDESSTLPPLYYFGKWGHVYELNALRPMSQLLCEVKNADSLTRPGYVLFIKDDDLDKRVAKFKTYFPNISYETLIEPGFIDKVLHKLNPRNKNYNIYIYRINYKTEEQKNIAEAKCD